ncbi:hypothetical protein STCU_10103 [Strigomonas culicis]|uniref:Uncharacterized protein n=1 Tax=Strigomonas culicis TaxID=28005 RepID=S9TP73_9TRYP|nr:hypothetical protein STCU_10103 [Strigomonas culicis]|eukprot:EPY18233.1 hypothetical protein STCU_10103 [Strigomonas culicis]
MCEEKSSNRCASERLCLERAEEAYSALDRELAACRRRNALCAQQLLKKVTPQDMLPTTAGTHTRETPSLQRVSDVLYDGIRAQEEKDAVLRVKQVLFQLFEATVAPWFDEQVVLRFYEKEVRSRLHDVERRMRCIERKIKTRRRFLSMAEADEHNKRTKDDNNKETDAAMEGHFVERFVETHTSRFNRQVPFSSNNNNNANKTNYYYYLSRFFLSLYAEALFRNDVSGRVQLVSQNTVLASSSPITIFKKKKRSLLHVLALYNTVLPETIRSLIHQNQYLRGDMLFHLLFFTRQEATETTLFNMYDMDENVFHHFYLFQHFNSIPRCDARQPHHYPSAAKESDHIFLRHVNDRLHAAHFTAAPTTVMMDPHLLQDSISVSNYIFFLYTFIGDLKSFNAASPPVRGRTPKSLPSLRSLITYFESYVDIHNDHENNNPFFWNTLGINHFYERVLRVSFLQLFVYNTHFSLYNNSNNNCVYTIYECEKDLQQLLQLLSDKFMFSSTS